MKVHSRIFGRELCIVIGHTHTRIFASFIETYKANRFHFCVRLYGNGSHKRSFQVNNKKSCHGTRRRLVPYFFFLRTERRHL